MDRADLIRTANERMSIEEAFRLIGENVSYASKQYCPFGEVFHQDGGTSRSLRIYPDTNSAFCFAGCGYMSPVSLLAMHRNISDDQAAEVILEMTNYVPPDYESQWDALQSEVDAVSTSDLAEALKVACARMSPDWVTLQFEDAVAGALSKCLALLPKVKSSDDSKKWMDVSKTVMRRAIQGG